MHRWFVAILFVTFSCMPVIAGRPLPPDLLSPDAIELFAWVASQASTNLIRANGVQVVSTNAPKPTTAVAALAVDGNPKTEWATTNAVSTLQIEFPAPTRVNGVFLQRDIRSEHPWDVGLGFAFDIEGSVDGQKWERVAGSPPQGLRITRWAVLFEPREVKFLRLSARHPARVGEIGAFLFDLNSAAKLGWNDVSFPYRIPLDMACVNRRADGTCSAGANLVLARGNEPGIIPADKVRVVAGGEACPTVFMPAGMKTPEQGWLYWREKPEIRGVRQLYFNVGAKDKAALPPCAGTWTAEGGLQVNGQVLKDAVPGRPYFVGGQGGGWIVPPPRDGLQCAVVANLDNYIRSKPVAAAVDLVNSDKQPFSGTLSLFLTGTELAGAIPLASREVSLAASENKTFAESLDISCVASGDYALTAQLVKESKVLAESRRPIFIAAAAKPGMGFGLYGLPYWNGLVGYAQSLRVAAESGFTVITGQFWGEDYSFIGDHALRYGLRWNPTIEPIYCCNTLADKDPTAACTSPDGKKIQWHPSSCYTHPDVVKQTEADVEKWLKQIVTYPGFDGRITVDDDVHLADTGCYNESCRSLFKKTTGLDVPQPHPEHLLNPKEAVPPGIVPDDQPWLQWYLFRCSHIRGNLPRIYMRAKNRVCPEVKMGGVRGAMQFPFYLPNCGEYPPLFDALYDVPGSYAYLYWVRASQDYIVHGALAAMGNRGKGPWILGDFSSWATWILEKQSDDRWALALMKSLNESGINGNLYPPGVLNKQIWCMFAGGFKFVHMFHLTEKGARNDVQGTEVEEVLREWGRRVRSHGALMTALREPARPVAVLVSITTSAFTEGLAHSGTAGAVFKDCLRDHVPVDLIAEEEIMAGDLKGRKVLLLPDLKYVRRSVATAIDKFIAEGGLVVADADAEIKPSGCKVAKRADMPKLAAGALNDRLMCDNPVVYAREFEYEGVRYYYLVNVYSDRWSAGLADDAWCCGDNSIFTELYTPRAQKAVLRLPANARTAWDVFGNRELCADEDGNLHVTVGRDDGMLMAVYPSNVAGIRLSSPSSVKAGAEVSLEARLQSTEGKPVQGGVPVEIRITDPKGNDSEYSQSVCATGGMAKYSFRTAVNDEPGKWKVTVRSLVGNAEASSFLRVRSP